MLKHVIILFLILFPGFDGALSSEKAPSPDVTELKKQLECLISTHIPGAILFIDSPSMRFWDSAGVSNIETQQKMPRDGLMPTGSAGKKLTALLVAMLHVKGVLDMDAPLKKYFSPEYLSQITFSEHMTIRHLLNHTSGIFEYNDSKDYAFFEALFSSPTRFRTDEFALSFALNQPAEFNPGTEYAYSNTGYALVGVILKNILGEHPASTIRSTILEPLNLTSSYIKAIEQHEPDFIPGYFINDQEPDFPLPMNTLINMHRYIGSIALSDAPLVSSVRDMAILLRSIVKENTVVNEQIRKQIIGEKYLVKAHGARFYRSSKLSYGLGIFVEKIGNRLFFHHGGTEFGYFTQNIYIPDRDISITAFANCGVNSACERKFQDFTFKVLDSFLKIGMQ